MYVRAQPALNITDPATMAAWISKLVAESYEIIFGHLLTDGIDEEPWQWHDNSLGHAPGTLDHNKVCIGDGGGAVLSHVGRHVGAHVPEGVEGAHCELKQESSKHCRHSSQRNTANLCQNTW